MCLLSEITNPLNNFEVTRKNTSLLVMCAINCKSALIFVLQKSNNSNILARSFNNKPITFEGIEKENKEYCIIIFIDVNSYDEIINSTNATIPIFDKDGSKYILS